MKKQSFTLHFCNDTVSSNTPGIHRTVGKKKKRKFKHFSITTTQSTFTAHNPVPKVNDPAVFSHGRARNTRRWLAKEIYREKQPDVRTYQQNDPHRGCLRPCSVQLVGARCANEKKKRQPEELDRTETHTGTRRGPTVWRRCVCVCVGGRWWWQVPGTRWRSKNEPPGVSLRECSRIGAAAVLYNLYDTLWPPRRPTGGGFLFLLARARSLSLRGLLRLHCCCTIACVYRYREGLRRRILGYGFFFFFFLSKGAVGFWPMNFPFVGRGPVGVEYCRTRSSKVCAWSCCPRSFVTVA